MVLCHCYLSSWCSNSQVNRWVRKWSSFLDNIKTKIKKNSWYYIGHLALKANMWITTRHYKPLKNQIYLFLWPEHQLHVLFPSYGITMAYPELSWWVSALFCFCFYFALNFCCYFISSYFIFSEVQNIYTCLMSPLSVDVDEMSCCYSMMLWLSSIYLSAVFTALY